MAKLKRRKSRSNGWLRCLRSSNGEVEGTTITLKNSTEVNQEIVLLNLYLNSLEKKIDLIRTFPKKCRSIGWDTKTSLRALKPLKNLKSAKYDDIIQHLISMPGSKKQELVNRPPMISDESSSAVIPINYTSVEHNKGVFSVAYLTARNDFTHRHDQIFHPVECHVAHRVAERFETNSHRTSALSPPTCFIRYVEGETPESNQLEIEYKNERLYGPTTGVIQLKEMDCSSNMIRSELVGRIVCYLLGLTSAKAVPEKIM